MYSTAERSVSTLLSFLLAPPCGTCCRSAWKPKFTSFTRLRSRSLRRATAASPPPVSSAHGRRRRLQRNSSGDAGRRRAAQPLETPGAGGAGWVSALLSITPAFTRPEPPPSPHTPQEDAGRGTGGCGTTATPQKGLWHCASERLSRVSSQVVRGPKTARRKRWRAVRSGERGALVSRACGRTLPRSF